MDLSYSPAYEIREPDTFSKENYLIVEKVNSVYAIENSF